MSATTREAGLAARVRAAVNEVLDPCSVGRGVPAGLFDMGMVEQLEVRSGDAGPPGVEMKLRLTSPGCTFQLYFERELRERLDGLGIPEDRVGIEWSKRFDWSDENMSAELQSRLRRKRELVLRRAHSGGLQRPTAGRPEGGGTNRR